MAGIRSLGGWHVDHFQWPCDALIRKQRIDLDEIIDSGAYEFVEPVALDYHDGQEAQAVHRDHSMYTMQTFDQLVATISK